MKRITYIDILKFFGIFLLLFEHTGNYVVLSGNYSLLKVWICSFHMPLFFVAYGMTHSGESILFKDASIYKSIFAFVEKKFSSLIIPYFLWSLIYSKGLGTEFFIGVLYGTNQSLYEAHTYQVLWFFPVFFLSNILYQIVIEISLRFRFKHLCFALSAIAFGTCSLLLRNLHAGWGIIFGFDIALTGAIYVILGKYIRILFDYIINKKAYILFAVIWVFIPLGWFIAHNNVADGYDVNIMAWAVYGKSYILGFVAAILNICGLLSACYFLRNIRFLPWLGKTTMLIMCIHPIVFQYSVVFCALHCGTEIFLALLNSIITVLISIPVFLFVNRYIPILIGKRSKEIAR